jgi:hypothetical protein
MVLNRMRPVMKQEKRRIIKEPMRQLGHIDTHYLSKHSVRGLPSILITRDLFAKPKGGLHEHNGMLYRMDAKWVALNPEKYPVND